MYPSSEFRLGFERADHSDLARWQHDATSKLIELLHLDRAPGSGITQVTQTESVEIDGVSQTRYLIEPAPWPPQPIYELRAARGKTNGVTIIAFHGHGLGDPFTGIYDYTRELARRGYQVVLPILFGTLERNTKEIDDVVKLCASWSKEADALGMSLLGVRLFDAALAHRFAMSLPGVDPARIGCIGLSMGGQLALYLAVLERSVSVCISVGFLSSFRSLLLESHNCQCYSIRGWPDYFDMPDLAGCMAPRPLQIQKGDDDPCFDAEDVAGAFARLRRIYEAFGRPECVEYATYPGGHCLNVDSAEEWLRRHLHHAV